MKRPSQDEVIRAYGQPNVITLDNGTEFTSNRFDQWAYKRRIELDFIAPGHPVENASIESFNGKLRDECLNIHWLESLSEARRLIGRRGSSTMKRDHTPVWGIGRRQPT